jgi:hypothetical protein
LFGAPQDIFPLAYCTGTQDCRPSHADHHTCTLQKRMRGGGFECGEEKSYRMKGMQSSWAVGWDTVNEYMLAFILVMYNNTDTGNGRKIIGMINL